MFSYKINYIEALIILFFYAVVVLLVHFLIHL
jgi:hypothetical protein